MTNVFFDLETTGLDSIKHSVITGYFYDSLKEDKFDLKCRPIEGKHWCKEAEKIHGISYDEAMSFDPRSIVLPQLMDWFSGREGNLVAHTLDNPLYGWFDFAFIKEFSTVHINGSPYRLWADHIKLKSLSTIKILRALSKHGILPSIITDKRRPTYVLKRWSQYFGIVLDHHNAESDTMACYKIYTECRKIFDLEVSMGRIDESEWERIAQAY